MSSKSTLFLTPVILVVRLSLVVPINVFNSSNLCVAASKSVRIAGRLIYWLAVNLTAATSSLSFLNSSALGGAVSSRRFTRSTISVSVRGTHLTILPSLTG